MRSIRRELTAMVGALTLAAAGALVTAQPASAKDGPISIQSVWVGNSNLKAVTALNSGQTATYHVDVDNTTGKAMKVEVEFEVFDISGPSSYSYYYTAHKVNMPAGLSRFYSPSKIPTAATTDNYMARITVWPTNSASPSNDGDYGEADFHIFSLNPDPIDNAIKALQDSALCIGESLPDGGDELTLVKDVSEKGKYYAIFEDLQTGDYWQAVIETFADSCVAALPELPALLQVYFPGA
jgi:hypothetical protein